VTKREKTCWRNYGVPHGEKRTAKIYPIAISRSPIRPEYIFVHRKNLRASRRELKNVARSDKKAEGEEGWESLTILDFEFRRKGQGVDEKEGLKRKPHRAAGACGRSIMPDPRRRKRKGAAAWNRT